MFLKSNIDISGLSNLVIEQANHVGSTIKARRQCMLYLLYNSMYHVTNKLLVHNEFGYFTSSRMRLSLCTINNIQLVHLDILYSSSTSSILNFLPSQVCDDGDLQPSDSSTECKGEVSSDTDSDADQVFGVTSMISLAYHHVRLSNYYVLAGNTLCGVKTLI